MDQHSKDGSGTAWLAGLIAFLVIYPLSPAPVAKAIESVYGPNPPDTVVKPFGVIYAPLFVAVARYEPAKRFYEWYFRQWRL